jgi:redox-sensing transcriptional repressor
MVERLSSYRRHLRHWLTERRERIYSHELGALIGSTAAQVRRDLMTIGFTGSPARGYDVHGLVQRISSLLTPSSDESMILVGVGHLGRAVLRYLRTTHPELPIAAVFDVASDKIGRIIDGCRCYAAAEIESTLRSAPALVGILTVPGEAAQSVAEQLIRAGVRGLLNFTPVRLHAPPDVYVEDVDISTSLEKVAFFARANPSRAEKEA